MESSVQFLLSRPQLLAGGPKLSKEVASLFQPGAWTDRQRRGAKGTHISQPALHHMAAPRYQGGSCADLGPFFKVPLCPGKNSITVQEGENRNWGKSVSTTAPTFTIFTYSCLKGAKMSFILDTGSFIQDHPWA